LHHLPQRFWGPSTTLGRKDNFAGLIGQPSNFLDNLNFDLGCPNDYLIFLEISNTVHSITNETPAEMLMGRQLRIRLDLIKPDITRQVHDK
jgi:hypothetical protein